ncbi:hypothetical protein HHK36_030697 [Tetracentron sinense]|uniref:Uncharacterized protein n=1 Tax=Tetracentron sinense TaxID=13715 RepID=A0A835CYX0_TETSI|nr:hypothetical protein HHK36_030697 [Tetracentron sinense]
MATVTVDSSSNRPQLDSISFVDIRFMSQSELQSLSICSDAAFDLRRSDDLVIPKIDRSVFNESAGSRKQTYSRLRLAPRKPEISSIAHRRRYSGILPIPKPPLSPIDDPERKENKRIVSRLKELLARENLVTDLIPIESEKVESFPEPLDVVESRVVVQEMAIGVDGGPRKRKRGRKPKPKVLVESGDMSKAIVVHESGLNSENRVMEILNRNGVVVDVAALGNADDPFGAELKRRTVGMETEAALLEFLKGLNGQWGSRRKKRKIVEASDFGDELPKGWKLLLSLKRKEGRVWLYCRRYISPNGQQFVSCKEVSTYLLSYFGLQDANQPNFGLSDENLQQPYKYASGSIAGLTYEDDNKREDLVCYSASPLASISNDHEKQVALLGIENLAEVQVRDLLECHKCNMTFGDKDAYLRHLLSSHQRTAKRCRVGSSIGDGVIVKDGKYECQFCHKIFHERHRYNGHVGVHVRNYAKSIEAIPGEITLRKSIDPASLGGVPSGVTKMDASLNIGENSIPEASNAKPTEELNAGSPHSRVGAVSIPEITTANSILELNFGSPHGEQDMEANKIDEILVDESCHKQDSDYRITDVKLEKIDEATDIIAIELNSCLDSGRALSNNEKKSNPESFDEKDVLSSSTDKIDKSGIEQERVFDCFSLTPSGTEQNCDVEHDVSEVVTSLAEEPRLEDVEKSGNNELKIGFGSSHAGSDMDVVPESIGRIDEENVMLSGVVDSSLPLVQSSDCFPAYSMISEKGEDEFCNVNQKLDNISGFEELRLDNIDPSKFDFMTGQESSSLPEDSMDLAYEAQLEQGFSIPFEWEVVLPKMDTRHQLATVCVWCRVEFNHEAFDTETQSDSVGFMCPTCKAKISGQLNVLENGLSMNSNQL